MINRNMRCIEIQDAAKCQIKIRPINRNMRCIEILYRAAGCMDGVD